MRSKVLSIALIALCAGASCSTGPQPNRSASSQQPAVNSANVPTPQALEAPRITLADAKKEFDAGTAVFIDTHSAEQYAAQHITGAINITVGDLVAKEDLIPKGKKIIAYCS